MTRQTLVTIMVIALALWIARCTGEQAGRAAERLDAQTRVTDAAARTTDSLKVEMAYRESTAVAAIRRLGAERDGARREIAVLKSRMIVPDSGNWKMAIAQRDTLIRAQDSLIAQQDSALTLWMAVAAAQDTVIERLTAERASYKNLYIAMRRQAEPGIFEQARRSLPFVLAGVVLWETARE